MISIANGYDVGYLTGTVGAGREGYYTGAVAAGGEPPGVWYGKGAAELGLTAEVDAELLTAIYTHGLDPRGPATWSRATWGEAAGFGDPPRRYRTPDQLYADYAAREPHAAPERLAELRARAEANARQPVAFYDVTFSVPKSVSVLAVACERAANEALAAGRLAEAEEWRARVAAIEEAVLAGARASIDFLEEHAAYARTGHHGGGAGRWIDAHRLVVAQFLQHDSRDHDPQLHVHQAILNRVVAEDGQVRGVDGQLIYRFKPAADAHGERVMEAELTARLGVRFADRPDGKVREIVGVPSELCERLSSRRRAITKRVQEMVPAFLERYGRDPNNLELRNLSQTATLATRRAKAPAGETREQFVERIERMTRAEVAAGLREVAENWHAITQVLRAEGPDEWHAGDVVSRALAKLAASKPAWTRADAIRAVSDALPGHLGLDSADVPRLLATLADQLLDHAHRLTVDEDPTGLPAELRRADGSSQYAKPGGDVYATPDQLAAERALRDAAVHRGAHAFTAAAADQLVDRYAGAGRALAADQAVAVRGVLTSGAMVEVLSAAAGTGKSFTVGVLADAWQDGGQRRVFGLATSQVAAQVLAEEGVQAMNTARWLATQDRLSGGGGFAGDHDYRLLAGDLVVVDEAGMSDTADLRAILARCRAAGAKLLLAGDPRQLAAVGAGGALADVGEHGIRYELAEVRRFTEAWERAASLRLREGDPATVAAYDKRGRIVDGGTVDQAEAAAGRAWLADHLAGKDALLVVGSNEAAARLCAQLRAELVSLGLVEEQGVPLGRQGTVAGVGDVVQARRNAWDLAGYEGNDRAPINRETYRVVAVHEDGSLSVAPAHAPDVTLTLPAAYVGAHLELAYASTVHAAQGRTVDTAHAVLGAGTDAAAAYVALTRGRDRNTAWMVTRAAAADAAPGEVNTAKASTGRAVLTQILSRSDAAGDRTGLAEAEQSAAVAASVQTHVGRLAAEIGLATAGRTGAILDQLVAAGQLAEHHRVALAANREDYGPLERLLRTAELAGHDPERVLTAAVTDRPLDGARFPAQVLHHRITTELHGQLTPTIATFADLVPASLPDDRRERLLALAEAADQRRHELGTQTAHAAPTWALDALGPVPAHPAERLDWEHRASWAAAYRELADVDDDAQALGRAPGSGLAEHRATWEAAARELDLPCREEADLTEGLLRARVRAAEREDAWAPQYVADELSAASRDAAREGENAAVWLARAEASLDPAEKAQLRVAADQARQRHAELQAHAEELTAADTARAAWFAHTAETRENADRARAELKARGVDLAEETPTTAAEWLAAHEAAQQAEDPHRAVRDEAELADVTAARARDTEAAAGETDLAGAAETDVADIRADTAARRATDTTERAQRALAEMRARAQEDARADEDEARSAEASRAAADERPAVDDDAAVLER